MTRRGLILFLALGVAWGIPYLFIKIAVGELEPAMVVFARSALAALLLMPLAIYRKQVMPVLKRWKPMLAYTIIEIIVPWFFLSSAEKTLPSSTAGLVTDGPFVESKEFVVGFWIIDVPSHEIAQQLAAAGSKACNRRVELRPFLAAP